MITDLLLDLGFSVARWFLQVLGGGLFADWLGFGGSMATPVDFDAVRVALGDTKRTIGFFIDLPLTLNAMKLMSGVIGAVLTYKIVRELWSIVPFVGGR